MAKKSKEEKRQEKRTAKQAKQKTQRQTAPRSWHRLDNTANLFPVITSKRFSNVYRLSIILAEPIIPELLQQALNEVLPWFAAFRVRLRRGIFWRYFEQNPATPIIQQEDDYPCRYIDPGQNNQFLFRITYFECRINLEVFHVLSDGHGGFQFLQAVCCRYLLLAHPQAFTEQQREHRWFAQHAGDTEDSYAANYTPTQKTTFSEGRAYSLKGDHLAMDALRVVDVDMPTAQMLQLCRELGVSVSQYLTACIGWAIYTQQMKKRPARHPVNIFVPVNLRGLFASTTTLNFFSSVYISLRFDTPSPTFEDVLAEVKNQYEQKVTKEAMQEKISYTVGSGYSPFIRVVPLPLKNMALRAIFEHSAKSSTTGFSNMGRIQMPEPFQSYVSGVSMLLSTAPREPFKCICYSYGGTFSLSFSSQLRSSALECAVVRHLADQNLDITIATNEVDYEKL